MVLHNITHPLFCYIILFLLPFYVSSQYSLALQFTYSRPAALHFANILNFSPNLRETSKSAAINHSVLIHLQTLDSTKCNAISLQLTSVCSKLPNGVSSFNVCSNQSDRRFFTEEPSREMPRRFVDSTVKCCVSGTARGHGTIRRMRHKGARGLLRTCGCNTKYNRENCYTASQL